MPEDRGRGTHQEPASDDKRGRGWFGDNSEDIMHELTQGMTLQERIEFLRSVGEEQ